MSKDGPEITRGGSRVLRHGEAAAAGGGVAPGVAPGVAEDAASVEAIEAHLAAHLGPPASVWHELVSDLVHIDVHVIPPQAEGEPLTLFTTGMSAREMTVPDELGDAPRRAELLLRLPPDWQLGDDAFSDERWYFPVRWLKILARLPHQYRTWLGWGHTIPSGDPPASLAPGVPFTGWIVAPPTCLDEAAATVAPPAGPVALLAIYPLHADELTYKLEHGADALFEQMDKAGVIYRIDPARPSGVPRGGRKR